jgi:hypothetical protein
MSPSRRRTRQQEEADDLDASQATPPHHRILGCVVILIGIGFLFAVIQASMMLSHSVNGISIPSSGTAQLSGAGTDPSVLGVLQKLEQTLRTGIEFLSDILTKVLTGIAWIFGILSVFFAKLVEWTGAAIAWIQSLPGRIGGA